MKTGGTPSEKLFPEMVPMGHSHLILKFKMSLPFQPQKITFNMIYRRFYTPHTCLLKKYRHKQPSPAYTIRVKRKVMHKYLTLYQQWLVPKIKRIYFLIILNLFVVGSKINVKLRGGAFFDHPPIVCIS